MMKIARAFDKANRERKRKPGRPKGTHKPPVYIERLQILGRVGDTAKLDERAAKAGKKRSAYSRELLGLD